MNQTPNILFIMADQLRADYLGCYGHPSLRTPHLDDLARRGVRFSRAFVQAPVCGGSRMSYYTGRYAASHGAYYNGYPLRIDELTLGDYLRGLGYRVALTGKTHMAADLASLSRLGVASDGGPGQLAAQGGFEPFERDDGLHPGPARDPDLAYNDYLRAQGYRGDNLWHDVANSAEGENGELLSGWHMRNSRLPARVAEEHSETAWMTDRAMAFIGAARAGEPWCLHLSYIKPHWPYLAPAPYHAMYSTADLLPVQRSAAERDNPNPVLAAFMQQQESLNFARDEVREAVIPAYMGLISQIDAHVGRLLGFLREQGLADRTIVVFCSDHGDYLGDHWLGEKDLYHDAIVRTPLIVCDPRAGADASRGSVCERLVESIDLLPTFVEWAGGRPPGERLEGRSLAGLIAGANPHDWRDAVFADGCFATLAVRPRLGLAEQEARTYMLRDERWKYVRFERHPPLLFDLQADPHELSDLGRDPSLAEVRLDLDRRLHEWLRRRRLRITLSDEELAARTGRARERGYLIGVW